MRFVDDQEEVSSGLQAVYEKCLEVYQELGLRKERFFPSQGLAGKIVQELSWRQERVREMHQMHIPVHAGQQGMNDRGFADIGYHYLIDRAGRVHEGRPMKAQGAHADGDYNIGNIGVCLLGNFSVQSERGPAYSRAQRPSAAQLETLERLLDQLCSTYNIKRTNVKGHRSYKATECPGDEVSRWVERYQRNG